jgi:hypothetical protein
MNKKILIGSLLAVFMLVAISYATAVKTTDVEKKESPLFSIRIKRAIGEKISAIIKDIKTKFLGERLNFIPTQWLRYNRHHRVGEATNKVVECEETSIEHNTCYCSEAYTSSFCCVTEDYTFGLCCSTEDWTNIFCCYENE